MIDNNEDAFRAAVDELLDDAQRMVHGESMLWRYAARQGWKRTDSDAGAALFDAAVFVTAAGRSWGDVLRAAS